MRLFTMRDVIRGVADKWHKRFDENPMNAGECVYSSALGFREVTKSSIDVGKRLDELDLETASEADISDIIGSEVWTTLVCGECKNKVDSVVVLNENYFICPDCLTEALKLTREG